MTEDLKQAAQEQFDRTTEKEKWMAVFFSIEGDNINCHKTTNNYPSREYLASLRLLKNMIDEELGLHFKEPKPLPVADLSRFPGLQTDQGNGLDIKKEEQDD